MQRWQSKALEKQQMLYFFNAGLAASNDPAQDEKEPEAVSGAGSENFYEERGG